MRGLAAVVAGIVGAATARALDATGQLPGVHEAAVVRTGLSPTETVAWLALAGLLAWLAVRTKPAAAGASSALVVSAIPELVGRHDVGAIAQPGAIAGALVQWLLVLAVVAVAFVVKRWLAARAPSSYIDPAWQPTTVLVHGNVTRLVDRRGRPRAPPVVLLSAAVF